MTRTRAQGPSVTDPRWLDPEAAAAYISVRVDELPRLRRAGKLPAPSYHLGPRKPRYDRLQLDAMFGDAAAFDGRAEEAAIVDSILARANRAKAARERHGQGISVSSPRATEGGPLCR